MTIKRLINNSNKRFSDKKLFYVSDIERSQMFCHIALENFLKSRNYKKRTINNYLFSAYDFDDFLEIINIGILNTTDRELELYRKILIRRGYSKQQIRRKLNMIKYYMCISEITFNNYSIEGGFSFDAIINKINKEHNMLKQDIKELKKRKNKLIK